MAGAAYNPAATKATAATVGTFVDSDLMVGRGSNSLQDVPGIGEKGIEKLKAEGIESSAALCGKFMTFYKDGMGSAEVLVRARRAHLIRRNTSWESGKILPVWLCSSRHASPHTPHSTSKYILSQEAFAQWLKSISIDTTRAMVVDAVARKVDKFLKGIAVSA